MPTLIESPTTVPAVGEPPKRIDEYVGRVNSQTSEVSVARANAALTSEAMCNRTFICSSVTNSSV